MSYKEPMLRILDMAAWPGFSVRGQRRCMASSAQVTLDGCSELEPVFVRNQHYDLHSWGRNLRPLV